MKVLLVLGAGMILFLGTSFVPAQKLNPKEKDATDTQLQEIGGKGIEQWIKEISSKDRSKGENAIRTVLVFGAERAYEAVPVLIKELKRQRGGIVVDVSIRVNATMALGTILGNVKEPSTNLVKEAVEVLQHMLSDSQSIVKYRAAQSLGMIGPPAKSAIPLLLNVVHDPRTWETRHAAAYALGRIAIDATGKKGPPPEVLKALYRALTTDSSSQVRLAAIQSLTWVGGPANEEQKKILVGYVKKATSEKEDPTIRIWAHMAIMSISHKIDAEHISVIASMLRKREMSTRMQAADALATIGSKAGSAVPSLISTLNDPEPVVVMKCIFALAQIGPEAYRAVAPLERLSQDQKRPEEIRAAAKKAIEIITTPPKTTGKKKKDLDK